jgi:hypothetical protein
MRKIQKRGIADEEEKGRIAGRRGKRYRTRRRGE